MRGLSVGLLWLMACAETPMDTASDDDTQVMEADSDSQVDADTSADTDADTEVANTDCAVAEGACAPDFSLPDATDTLQSLSDLQGDRVLLMGTAMWCPPCIGLAEDVSDWVASEADDDVAVVIVILEDRGRSLPDASDAARFVDDLGLDSRVVVLADSNGEWAQSWGNTRYSYTAINSDGTIAWHQLGYQPLSSLTGAMALTE